MFSISAPPPIAAARRCRVLAPRGGGTLKEPLPWEPEPEPEPQQLARVQQQQQQQQQQHPIKQPHAARNLEFVRWLVETFGLETLRGDPGGEGILDIAGGRGAVAFALQATHGIPTLSLIHI